MLYSILFPLWVAALSQLPLILCWGYLSAHGSQNRASPVFIIRVPIILVTISVNLFILVDGIRLQTPGDFFSFLNYINTLYSDLHGMVFPNFNSFPVYQTFGVTYKLALSLDLAGLCRLLGNYYFHLFPSNTCIETF